MGYNTYYTLEWETEDDQFKLPLDFEALEDGAINEDGSSNDSCKWYDHHEDMLALSRAFPHVLFKLYGEGEENDDTWYKYYKDGKYQVCRAIITYDPYDESKLT